MKNLVEEAITDYAGERCPDHDPDCPVCQTWAQWDKLNDEHKRMYDLLKRMRTISTMAGFYDAAQDIDNLIGEIK